MRKLSLTIFAQPVEKVTIAASGRGLLLAESRMN
jgi:hypothetical protein